MGASTSRQTRVRTRNFGAAVLAATALLGAACSSGSKDSSATTTSTSPTSGIRFNQIQLVGTHNSYHIAPVPSLFAAEKAAVTQFGEKAKELGDIDSLNYSHRTLTQQLDSGVRSFELDTFADPAGGLFAKPLAPVLLKVADAPMPQGMDAPGFKVLHIQDIDYMSTCPTLDGCLQELAAWSQAHPRHIPIVVNLELKDGPLPSPLDATKVVPFDAAQMDALDTSIRGVFDEAHLLTPDDVRGTATTLRSAVENNGWPLLDSVRGTTMFFMDNGGDYRTTYLAGHPSLQGRVMFTSDGEGSDDAAVIKVNEPADGAKINALVRKNYFIRTRADADLVTDPARRTVAFDSGAQIVSTDYPIGEPSPTGYMATIGKGLQVGCNAVAKASRCSSKTLE